MKKRTVIFSPESKDDLIALYDWIADAANPDVALSYIERIEAHCLNFDLAAERGHRRDDIRPGLRISGFENRITIAFFINDDSVTFLRFFYGGRNWESGF